MIVSIKWPVNAGETPPVLLGDFTQWEPVEGTAVNGRLEWQFDVEYDARLEYCFMTGDNRLIPDPANENRVMNGLGAMSELVMPGYEYHPVFEPFRHGVKSSTDHLNKISITSRHLGYIKEVWIVEAGRDASLLPGGQNPGISLLSGKLTGRMFEKKGTGFIDNPGKSGIAPFLLVFQDGLDYLEFAHAETVLHYLFNNKLIPPTVALFVNPPNRHAGKKPDRMTEYGMNPLYAAFIAEELIPRFSNITNRAIIGASYGGLCAIHTAMLYPGLFSAAYSQSGYVGYNSDALFELVGRSDKSVSIYTDIGTWERSVGRSFLDNRELDFLAANRRFRDMMQQYDIPHTYCEHHEGHTWGYWRNGLVRMLPAIIYGDRL
ncbi:MAG: esterase family protein [Balneolaceae bacterium]|nr:MAG: esterase family protein [Balneolaceae bacterium]